MCLEVVKTPNKMTARKFFGNHFHSLVTHAPITYRLLCLRSVIPEEEERSFGELRSISKNTSNRQASQVVDNAVLRFNAQQKYSEKINTFARQESAISQQAKLLNKRINTSFPIVSIMKNPHKFQAHLQRISDFLLCGENVWWTLDQSSVIFLDVDSVTTTASIRPHMFFSRSSSIQDVQNYIDACWSSCLEKISQNKLEIPLHKIKIYEEEKCLKIIHTDVFECSEDDDTSLKGNFPNICFYLTS